MQPVELAANRDVALHPSVQGETSTASAETTMAP
eukprot:CAMPEP_0206600190 /NCGR_PEP_ID=MMETSP0325_2-20121206/45631_1 /ASSEMBLY_ACC=CAM_ASM_000347 /TAXON_ID=2866 /ORGANISM="Crypthecodinium cohnii, Strain Seligo" /LENGTH=33 /DNA_ID= /DNA_START= /DNA_END= /DNA_ORIENTATION=